jgi:hypothetical protein
MQETMWTSLGKDSSSAPDEEKVSSLAAIAKVNKLTATRPDRRFPNQNQINNCWCVKGRPRGPQRREKTKKREDPWRGGTGKSILLHSCWARCAPTAAAGPDRACARTN